MKNTDRALEGELKEHVSALYELMRSEKLEELEIKQSDFYVFLKRKGAAPAPVRAAAPAAVAAVPETAPVPETLGETVKSPITGVFYRAPSPASPPFVKEGDVVETGKTLCIVEAMKVMNEIKAECRMKILKILVENGKPITAAQDLFQIQKM